MFDMGTAFTSQRLRSEDRRSALLGVAAEVVAEEGLASLTMDRVAARAGVSRPLVYKHFENREQLLVEVFKSELARFDELLARAVEAAEGLEGKVRALVRGSLELQANQAAVYQLLLPSASGDRSLRREQRQRDGRTVRYFARLAVAELGLSRPAATAACAMLLSSLGSVRAQARAFPGEAEARFLEDLYVDLFLGGLRAAAEREVSRA